MTKMNNNKGLLPIVLKILVIGDSSVGKSSLLLRYVDDQFSPSFITTVGIDFKIKDVVLPSTGTKVKLQIWDTAGQERFRTITAAYYRGAMAIVIVYDVTNKQSFSHLTYWVSQVAEQRHDHPPICVIVGNKSDMAEQRTVGDIEGRRFAEANGCLFAETSAYTGRGVSQLFVELGERILAKQQQQQEEEAAQSLVDLTAEKTDKKGGGCCYIVFGGNPSPI
jgi:Ras-related protein Rab-8A